MTLETRSRQYAQALLTVAEKLDSVRAVQDSLTLVGDISKKVPSFKTLIQSRKIQPVQKKEILINVLKDDCHPLVIEFLGTLDTENNFRLLEQVRNFFDTLAKQVLGIIAVRALVAEALDETTVDSLHSRLNISLGQKTDLAIDVDPALLGGIKLRIENLFMDASLQCQLDRMRKTFKQS